MSQRAVEGLLGRLITDREFRERFYADPAATCARESLDLTSRELDALLSLDRARLQAFARDLDARIVRAAVGGPRYWGNWAANTPHRSRERSKPAQPERKPRLARGGKFI